MIIPSPLRDGDLIAICSPAGAVDPSLFPPAIDALQAQGWKVKVMPHAMGRQGTYAAAAADRLADIKEAFADPQVKAIMCGRGGYGAVHLLQELAPCVNPKWLIGFSDISALHALMQSRGIASAHANMLRGLARDPDGEDSRRLFALLRGKPAPVELPEHPLNRPGHASGILAGGNLSVLSALIGTPFDALLPGRILVIEDINEPIYKLERMLWQLRLRGVLPTLGALVAGQFTGTEPDANYADAYQMIADMCAPYAYPLYFGAPIGHRSPNRPLLLGAHVRVAPHSLEF